MTRILRITKKDLDKDNFYKEPFIDFDGQIEADNNLGTVKFKQYVRASLVELCENMRRIKNAKNNI